MFGAKEKSAKLKKIEEIVLPNAKLKFCADQLQNLNFIFNKRLERNETDEDLSVERSISLAKSVTERLVQRLLCGAAQIDTRFASKFLINNRLDQHDNNTTHLEYIVRLDALSTPLIYESDEKPSYEVLETDKDCPNGYAKIRLNPASHKRWAEFVNSFGFLRRDRIQARLVELLARAAASDGPTSPLHVDESIMCGVPGKILDPATLYYILKTPSNQQVYYGPGGNVPRFPDTRDFRLAIVDEPNGIKLKVEFLSPALANISVKVTILVALEVDAWPSSSDFPYRIPLGHSDCLLHYQAAQTGMYLVGYGVHSSAWQIRLPAAEFILLNYYEPNSAVRTILDILYEVLQDINAQRRFQKPMSYKILNRYMLFTLLMEELEENSDGPFSDMVNWSPMYLSTLVLKLLDKAIMKLNSEFQSNYFFNKANLLVNPGHLCDEDFIIEARNVKNYMAKLFDESLMSNIGNEDFNNLLISQETELNLLYKWKRLLDNMMPPSATIGRKLYFTTSKNKKEIAHTQYTARQLEYISLMLHNMLKVKQHIIHPHDPHDDFPNETSDSEDNIHPLEDIIYILVTLLDQAKDKYFSDPNIIARNRSKIKSQYYECVSKLVDSIRKDKEIFSKHSSDLQDDLTLVKLVLKWLYKAMDQNKKCLKPILRAYLNSLFASSYNVSYHLELIKDRLKTDEMEAINTFCKLVNCGCITPAQGLMDSINKNWLWAKRMLEMVEKNTLRLVFVQERGKVYRHILSLPSYNKNEPNMENYTSKTWSTKEKRVRSIKRRTTLPGRNYFSSLLNDESKHVLSEIPQHEILKKNSPLTVILKKKYRWGQHRCAGDLLKTMSTMQKLNVFQEATSSLAQEDQSKLTNIIDNIHTAKAKRALNKKWSSTLPHSSKLNPVGQLVQKYTPKEESAGIRLSPMESCKSKNESLLGSSRAARLKEDNSVYLLQENFRIKCLLKRSESIK